MTGLAPFRSAVVPAAGLGVRFLPATKAVPKVLFPVVDTPGIEFVAAEAAEAGAERLVVVTAPGDRAVAAYFAPAPWLEEALAARGRGALAGKVRRPAELLAVQTVEQPEPKGLGHAVGCGVAVLDPDESCFAVLLPDDVVLPTGVLSRMSVVREQFGGSVLCAVDVPPADVSAYGVFAVADTDDPDVKRVVDMVEKPDPAQAPSTLAAVGRYLFDRCVADAVERLTPGVDGQLQLTDVVPMLLADGHPVHVVVHRGRRHDIGHPGGYVRAFVDFALDDPDLGPDLQRWLVARLEG